MSGKIQMIIDCDVGLDDAQAIMMALGQPDIVNVVAITTVVGNSSIENVTRNTISVLDACHRADIPVYKGASLSLLGRGSITDGYFGTDGFGEVTMVTADSRGVGTCTERGVEQDHAAVGMAKMVAQNPGKLTLVAIGPLTNVALAMHFDPNMATNIKQLVIMGGNTKAQGNNTLCAEMNFRSDPEAACFVLSRMSALGRLVTIIPLELCQENELSWEFFDELVNVQNKKAEFLKTIMQLVESRERGVSLFGTWDQIAMATTLDPGVAIETTNKYITIELHGNLTRGLMLVDWNGKMGKTANARLITKLNMDRYREQMRKIVDV